MKSDKDLQLEIHTALKLLPQLYANQIVVTVADGIITLTGTVNSFVKKIAAEKAAESVVGVRAVIEKIDVIPDGVKLRTDDDIKAEVMNIFKSHWDIPDEKIEVTVKDSLITLEGTINWHYQKEAATKSISSLKGVKSINNNIVIERKQI